MAATITTRQHPVSEELTPRQVRKAMRLAMWGALVWWQSYMFPIRWSARGQETLGMEFKKRSERYTNRKLRRTGQRAAMVFRGNLSRVARKSARVIVSNIASDNGPLIRGRVVHTTPDYIRRTLKDKDILGFIASRRAGNMSPGKAARMARLSNTKADVYTEMRQFTAEETKQIALRYGRNLKTEMVEAIRRASRKKVR